MVKEDILKKLVKEEYSICDTHTTHVECVILMADEKGIYEVTLKVQFKSGIVMKQRIPYCN